MAIKITEEELKLKFNEHLIWLQSQGKQGVQLDLKNRLLTQMTFNGCSFRGAILEGTVFSGCMISNVDFCYSKLAGAYFIGADILFSDFSHAEACYSNFAYAKVNGSKFYKSNLMNVNFQVATFERCGFIEADIRNSIFTQAKLINVDLNNATLGSTDFADTDLTTAINLESMNHMSTSIFSIKTISNFGDNMPIKFLTKAGVSESLIERFYGLEMTKEDYYSCFISYATADEDKVKSIYDALWCAGVSCWFAPENLRAGKKVHEQLFEGIEGHEKLVIVLSESSMKSEWVKTELRKAFKLEQKTGERKLFPISLVSFDTLRDWECFDSDFGKDLAVELREYFIPSFHDVKSNADFSKVIERLVLDLKKI
ncbi:TPA: TIR domain-containing protein [Vibrio vulnificus]|nr:TIR domain-containing protein [Vibrio vulnificus]